MINWGPCYVKATRTCWTAPGLQAIFLVGREGNAIDIVSIAEDVPARNQGRVEEVKGLADGSFSDLEGPIRSGRQARAGKGRCG